MAIDDTTKKELASLIKINQANILDAARNEILDHPKYQILKTNHLDKFALSYPNPKDEYIFIMNEEELKQVNLAKVSNILQTKIIEELSDNKLLVLDRDFTIVEAKRFEFADNTTVRNFLHEKSEQQYCAFYFSEEGISVWIKGKVYGNNIFFSNQDRRQYQKKYKIEDILEVFGMFKNQKLPLQVCYSKFFVGKQVLKSIYGDDYETNKNLLKNSPEKYFRDELREFLNDKMQVSFQKEMELSATKKELDLFTEVDHKFYLIEIKCVGDLIDKDNQRTSTKYRDAYARSGVKQTLEYIEELIVTMKQDVRKGYLVVFDARKNKTPLNYDEYSNVPQELKKYIPLLGIYDEMKLDNTHPVN